MLSALVVRAGVSVDPAGLAEAYWGEGLPATWAQQVKTSIARIRQRMGHEVIQTVGSGYRLGIDADDIDARQFESLVAAAREHTVRGEPDRAVDAYRRALAMWRGKAFQDLPDWQPGLAEAMRLDGIRRSAEEELLEARLATGEGRGVIPDAERLVHEDPLREDRWAFLALANYQANRQAVALAVLREARERLADDLGVDPGPRLVALEAAVLRQDTSLMRAVPMRRVSEQCPYRGLEPFGPDDADTFFGRDADIEHVVERARPGAVVAIAGPSGSGKSSLLLAGVVSRLVGRGRTVRVLRPGTARVAEIRDATEGSSRADVLAVDQAEELMVAGGDVDTFCEVAWRFASAGGTVLLTVRSDFIDEAAALPHIGPAIARGVYVLGPMSRAALREAVEAPPGRAGLRLEPGLVELVLRDTEGHPAALPHLSHALLETWVRREGATLTVAGYEAAGGIAGAIAQSAEDLYRSLGSDDRELCRSLMLRLVEQTPEGTPVRRRRASAPLLDDPARRGLIERLAASRLVALDGDAVVIAHEAVATAWPRLEGWLEDEGSGARLMAGLSVAAETWHDDGRPDEDLARGGRLESLLEWRDRSHPDLTTIEADFLEASAGRERDEVRAVTERAARDRLQNWRLRRALVGVAGLLAVALGAGAVAGLRTVQANASRDTALRANLVSTSEALDGKDPVVGALLAAEAYKRWPASPDTRAALMTAMTDANGLVEDTIIPDPTGGPIGLAVVPGTRTAVVAQSSGALEVRDLDTGMLRTTLTPGLHADTVGSHPVLAVSADGSTLAVLRESVASLNQAEADGEASFYDMRSGHRIGDSIPNVGWGSSIALSPSGRTAAWVTPDAGTGVLGIIHVADVATGTVRQVKGIVVTNTEAGSVGVVAFTPDGGLLVGTGDGHLLVVDPATLKVTRTYGPWAYSTNEALVTSSDGTVVASGQQGIVRVKLSTGTQLWSHQLLATHWGACGALAVADREVFCADIQNVTVRDLATGEPVGSPLRFTGGNIGGLSPLGDNELVAIPSATNQLAVWRIDGGGPVSQVIAPGEMLAGGYDPSGRYIITGLREEDATPTNVPQAPFAVWDPTNRQRVFPAGGKATVSVNDWFGWSGAGRILARADGAPDVTVDVRTGATGGIGDMAMPNESGWPSPTGQAYYVVYDEGNSRQHIEVLDSATMRSTGQTYDVDGDVVTDLEFSPDGSRMAVRVQWNGRPETSVFDTATTKLIAKGLTGGPWTVLPPARDVIAAGLWIYDGRTVFDTGEGKLVSKGLTGGSWNVVTPAGNLIAASASGIGIYGRALQPMRALPLLASAADGLWLSADGNTLAVGTDTDTAVILYDLRTGVQLGPGLPQTTPIGTGWIGLRPDGRQLAYTVSQGVAVWDLDPADQYKAACTLAGRELTAAEWTAYLSGLGARRATCADVLGS
jgi:DNA-binding SARP family transcriptional activator/WD40 repeat protein